LLTTSGSNCKTDNFLQGAAELGLPILDDPNRGIGYGATFAPSSMSPCGQARSDARTAYVDSVIDRPNLHLATQQTVTRILLEKRNMTNPVAPYGPLRRAFGVEVSNSQGTRWNVTCSKEVILAAGALVSPVLLQVSGIGPASLLASINVTVQVDLPGVGMNFQDHGMVAAFYDCE
jgi:choline dehydrogenase